jgi:hypothetical protein
MSSYWFLKEFTDFAALTSDRKLLQYLAAQMLKKFLANFQIWLNNLQCQMSSRLSGYGTINPNLTSEVKPDTRIRVVRPMALASLHRYQSDQRSYAPFSSEQLPELQCLF